MALTQEEINKLRLELEYLKLQEEQAQETAPPKEKWYEDLGEGLAVSGLETVYGVKDLFGKMTDEDRATLADWRADAGESGWGTAGQVIGDVGQMAVPGGAALRGLKAARALKNIGGGARFATDVATGGGLGYIQAPEEGETRGEGAVAGAGGAVLGGAMGKLLGKAVKGINVTPDARKLMDEGIELTPGQASESPIWRGVENVMSTGIILTAGSSTAILRDRALAQWNKKVLNDVRPPGMAELKDIGIGAQKALKKGFDKAYGDAWAKGGQPPDAAMFGVVRQLAQQGGRLDNSSQTVVRNIMDDIIELSSDFTPEKMRGLDNALRKQINRANSPTNPNSQLSDVLKGVRDRFREVVSKEAREELQNIDSQYGKYLVARDAGAAANKLDNPAFTPQQLMNQAARIGKKGRFARGEAPLQTMGGLGARTIGRKEPPPILNLRKAVARNIPGFPAGYNFVGRRLMGEGVEQKRLQDIGRSKLAEALRGMGIRPAAIGAAYTQENE